MLTYIHPISAAVVTLLLFYVGSLGLQSRSQPRRAAPLLRRHARLAPRMFALMLVIWVGGVASTWAWRPDLDLLASTHFQLGCLLVAALTGAWLTSKAGPRSWMRESHPWFGIAALLLAAAQVFFGLQIAP